MTLEFEVDAYTGGCSICGSEQIFERKKVAIRETYRCENCKAILREREHARAMLKVYGEGINSIEQLVVEKHFQEKSIYEPGTSGAIRKYLKNLPNYSQSDFYDKPEEGLKSSKIPHQNLESLTYADAIFDLVLTSDILEHVRNPLEAFSEIARILKIGGYHIFTVPMQYPIQDRTISRVKIVDGIDVLLSPAQYHGNGKGGQSLVYSNFGLDIVLLLSKCGFSTLLLKSNAQSNFANKAVTLICQRVF